jgi:hypothetical protein
LAKKWRFFLEPLQVFAKKTDNNIGFYEKRPFFRQNWRKPPKILIITSIPGHPATESQHLLPQ